MTEGAQAGLHNLLINRENHATIQSETIDQIVISRADAEQEHSILIARLHYLRRKLGYPPLNTGKEVRRAQVK